MSSDDARPAAAAFGSCPAPVADRERILLGHGSGGTLSTQLVERVFLPALGNPVLARLEDQAVLPVEGGRIALTTDAFVVTPLEFPGGDIGSLAVHGTVNDLAMGGARPLALSAAFILEEGLRLDTLQRVADSMGRAARAAGVAVVAGDTKVVGKGSADQLFVCTTGIGVVPPGLDLGAHRVRAGDVVLVSGTVGDHGVAIMAARQDLGLQGELRSDSAALYELVAALLAAAPGTHALRDPTRGGLAATFTEIAVRAGLGIEIEESAVPVRDDVRGACEILGLDPMLVANEGKLVAFVPAAEAEAALFALRGHALGREAARIGVVTGEHPGRAVARTPIGGRRVIERAWGELLPRIC